MTCANTPPASADGLVEGKCGIVENSTTFQRCTLIQTRGEISVLANNGSNLLLKAKSSEILRISPLNKQAEAISPSFKSGLPQTLSGLGLSAGDAQRSMNVKLIQARARSGSPVSLLFVAERNTANIDQLNANLINIDNTATNNPQDAELVPSDIRQILQDFDRSFARIQGLYEALLFEEADRVFDRTQIELRNFSRRFGHYAGATEVINVLNSRTRQLETLRNLKSYDYQVAQWQAERRYDRIQREKAAAEEQRRKQEYLLAVEQRKTAEANARKWWAIWLASRPAIINTVINNNVIITR